jgi:hypothetical protein
MLKQLIANKKKIPVPVPLLTLKDAIGWVESVLVLKDHSITKIELNGKLIEYGVAIDGSPGRTPLTDQSKLEIQIDSPLDLSIQTIDVIRTMAMVMKRSLRVMAVTCWQSSQRTMPAEIDVVASDLGLIRDLVDHLALLLKGAVSISGVETVAVGIDKLKVAMEMAISGSDWQGVAKILLKQLEPKLIELHESLDSLQRNICEYQLQALPHARSDISSGSR